MSDGLVLVDTCAWIDFLRYQVKVLTIDKHFQHLPVELYV